MNKHKMQHTCIIKIENTITAMAIMGAEGECGCRKEGKKWLEKQMYTEKEKLFK